jgi:DNA-nicking Smr family endonuclease
MFEDDDIWHNYVKQITRIEKIAKVIFRKKSTKIKVNALPKFQLDELKVTSSFDKQDYKLRKKDFDIDATLDLHGLTQKEAQSQLIHKFERCLNQNHRHLLIITGKGVRLDGSMGVIRERLPEWLNSDSLSKYIGAFSNAKPEHGGDGAFYVRLKKI